MIYDADMSCCNGPTQAPDFDPDDEGPSQADLDRFDIETAYCPECCEEVYDQASICQHCGAAIGDETLGKSKLKSTIFTIGLIIAGVAFILVFALST